MTYKITQAILVLSDKNTVQTKNLYNNIKRSVDSVNGTVFLLYHNRNVNNTNEPYLPGVLYHCFNDNILKDLGYSPIEESLLPGSNHFPLLDFHLQYPNFDFYWVIEDDVRFNGNWSDFFMDFTKKETMHDFLTSHIREFAQEPFWYWWDTLVSLNSAPPILPEILLRSFNPIYRISNQALRYIDKMLKKGWKGHHEVLIPTLISQAGYSLLDFGGEGKFVIKGFENKYYSENADPGGDLKNPGTMRFRPVMRKIGPEKNKLYHPIKPRMDKKL